MSGGLPTSIWASLILGKVALSTLVHRRHLQHQRVELTVISVQARVFQVQWLIVKCLLDVTFREDTMVVVKAVSEPLLVA